MGIESLYGKREAYYGKYSGKVTKQDPMASTDSSTGSFVENLKDSIPEYTTGKVVGGTQTALGIKKVPKKDTSTTHTLTVEINSSKIVAMLDGKELSDCGYKVGVEGGGIARLLANDMDVSLTIEEATPDGTKAQKVYASLNTPGDGGQLTRV